jgi:hypothetical protein
VKVDQVKSPWLPGIVSSPGLGAVGSVPSPLPVDSFSPEILTARESKQQVPVDMSKANETSVVPSPSESTSAPLPSTVPSVLTMDQTLPPSSLQSVGPVSPTKAFQAPLSRKETSAALTLKVLLKRQAGQMSSELREKLYNDPLLVGTLCGVTPGVSLKLSPEDTTKLSVIVDSMELSMRRGLALLPDPQQEGNTLLLGRSVGYMFADLNWGLRKLPGRPEALTPEAMQKIQEGCDENKSEALSCVALLKGVSEQRLPGPKTPGKVGMIAYVSSDYQLQRFGEVIEDWKSNFTDFGHHHVQFTVCDDSPEPYGTEMRKLLQQASKDSPVRFGYLGTSEKAKLRNMVADALKPSLSLQDATKVSDLVAGAGATQNRNLSLQLLGKTGGLQVDHDMTAEVLAEVSDKPIAYDILEYLEREAPQGGGLASFRFCGAYDVSIDYIASLPLPPMESQFWNASEDREPKDPEKTKGLMDEGMGQTLRAPMVVPVGADPGMRIAPGLRDGDIALDTFSRKISGVENTGLGHYVHHRDEAGSRWGAGKLMSQYLLFEMVNESVSSWLPDEKYSPSQAGEAILEKLKTPDSWPNFERLWDYADYQQVAESYVQRRDTGLVSLNEMTAQLDSGSGDAVLQQWSGEGQAQNKDLCQEQLQGLQKRLQSDREDMKQSMHIGLNGQMDKEALQADMQAQAADVLRTQALALIHADKIAEVLASGADSLMSSAG